MRNSPRVTRRLLPCLVTCIYAVVLTNRRRRTRDEFCENRGGEGRGKGLVGRNLRRNASTALWLSFDFDVRRRHRVPPEKSAISYHLPVARHRVNGHVNAIILLLMKSAPSICASLLGNRVALLSCARETIPTPSFRPFLESNFLSSSKRRLRRNYSSSLMEIFLANFFQKTSKKGWFRWSGFRVAYAGETRRAR